MQKHLGHYLWDALEAHASAAAFIACNRDKHSETLSYQQWKSLSASIAEQLKGLGIEAEQKCALLMTNQFRWPVIGTAVFWMDGTLVPVDYKLSPAEQKSILLHCEAKVVFMEYAIWKRWEKEGVSLPEGVRFIVSEAPEKKQSGLKAIVLEDWLQPDAQNTTSSTFEMGSLKNELACIVYSSGTGGDVKACCLTHRNYLAQIEAFAKVFPAKASDRFFSILPTNHAIDFMLGFIYLPRFGAAVVHQRTLRPEYLRWTMQNMNITHIALVPLLLRTIQERITEGLQAGNGFRKLLIQLLWKMNAGLRKIWDAPGLSKWLLFPIHQKLGHKLRLIIAGGAYVPPATAQFFYDLGVPVSIGYGLTEAGTALTVNKLDPFRADTVGTPVGETQIEIRNQNAEGVGEVWASGPTLMRDYYKNEDLTQQSIQKGWLNTGDLGLIDASGHLVLKGRKKNMIVTPGGKNVYPEDIEPQFLEIPEIEEFCIFSESFLWADAQALSDGLCLVYRAKEGLEVSMASIEASNTKLSDYQRLSSVLCLREAFPRTASMKIKRTQLAKAIGQRHGYGQRRPLKENRVDERAA